MPRSGSVRIQRLAPTRVRVREKRASLGPRPPTVTGNSPNFPPLASTMVFSVMDGPKNVMQLRLRPSQDEKLFFYHDLLVIEVGAHHIYDDTGFCHNYCHRSVICMTEIFFVRPKMSRMCLFFVVHAG